MSASPSRLFIVCMLGALSVISPFAIDMYLPLFPQMAQEFGVNGTAISLTISSYFTGMALGQIFYGPLLDRYGRKKPLYFGLGLFILAALACATTHHILPLIALRFLQAFGGCAAGVSSLAMIRDFFPIEEGAKILSRLFLFIAVSPLAAPSVGGIIMQFAGWRFVFVLMATIVALILALMHWRLPESHQPDTSISLRPGPILREYIAIIRHPKFATYAFAGAFSFAGLFTYVAGSPIIFMEDFHLSARHYAATFAGLAMGFIGGSQLNVRLLKRYSSETLFARILILQVIIGWAFVAASWFGIGLLPTLGFFFCFLACSGIAYPNAAAIALSPFARNAGSAAAMLNFLQLGIGAGISTFISVAPPHSALPIIAILGGTVTLAILVLAAGYRKAHRSMAMD